VFELKRSSRIFGKMNRAEKIVICLATGVALAAGAHADDAAASGNPYALIVARNVFGLNPPPPPGPATPFEPPPKITPNGIMTVFGEAQVLFKVEASAKRGQPAKEDYYILSEGQRQDDIEVVKIDNKAGMVTFNNHGVVQQLALVSAPATTTVEAGGGERLSSPRFRPPVAPGGENNGRGINRFGRGRNNSVNSSEMGNEGSGDDGSNLRSIPTRDGYSSQQSQMTAAEQAAAILVNTEKYKEQGNPAYQLMPPIPGFGNQSGNQPQPPAP
jgi:hypothetical protein